MTSSIMSTTVSARRSTGVTAASGRPGRFGRDHRTLSRRSRTSPAIPGLLMTHPVRVSSCGSKPGRAMPAGSRRSFQACGLERFKQHSGIPPGAGYSRCSRIYTILLTERRHHGHIPVTWKTGSPGFPGELASLWPRCLLPTSRDRFRGEGGLQAGSAARVASWSRTRWVSSADAHSRTSRSKCRASARTWSLAVTTR